jgi:phage I-like protein
MNVFTLCTEISDKNGLSDWVELIPAGSPIIGRDGRQWKNSDPQSILKQFESRNIPLAIDYEHATDLKKGEASPAAGWISKLEVKDGGSIWGNVEWTEKAKRMIESKEYRFLSPVFTHTATKGEIRQIIGAGLTNRPNFELTALNSEQEAYNELSKSLGISVSTPEDVLTALNRQHHEIEEKKATDIVEAHIANAVFAPSQRDFLIACCQQQGADAFEAFAGSHTGYQYLKTPPSIPDRFPQAINSQLTDVEAMACAVVGVSHEEFLNTNHRED